MVRQYADMKARANPVEHARLVELGRLGFALIPLGHCREFLVPEGAVAAGVLAIQEFGKFLKISLGQTLSTEVTIQAYFSY